MAAGPIMIFSGSSNPGLAKKIAEYLGITLGNVELKRFSDGELWVKYKENIRGGDVFIIQSTNPPSENFLELLIMLDAAKRSSASTVTAVIPYFGYARQDRKDQPRVAITAKLVSNLITKAGADRVIAMDLHAAQIQGFFDIPSDHLYASTVFMDIWKKNEDNLVVVSPDIGGIKLARAYSRRLNVPLVVIDKRRPKQNKAEVMNIIGDVNGKDVLLVDDIIDTGGTFVSAIEALKEAGANKIFGAVTHPILSGDAVENIENSSITKLYVTDSVPLKKDIKTTKIIVKTASGLLSEAIRRTHNHESISSLFDVDKS